MSLVVNSNISSLNSQRQLGNATNDLSTSFERLSSGQRINSAADDAAGLQISSRLTSQINGLDQASRNANDGISVAQTAEGALDEYTESLQRLRTLAVQSSNGSNSSADRTALNAEFTELSSELTRISEDTEFGGQNLLDGQFNAEFQIGANAGQTLNISITADLTSGILATSAVAAVAAAASTLTSDGGISTAAVVAASAQAARATQDVLTFSGAQAAIGAIDDALAEVNGVRANLGATQNRFESIIRSNDNTSENVSASRSRIEDTDFASETANLARATVLQQASSSLLAQANQQPQIALSLI